MKKRKRNYDERKKLIYRIVAIFIALTMLLGVLQVVFELI